MDTGSVWRAVWSSEVVSMIEGDRPGKWPSVDLQSEACLLMTLLLVKELDTYGSQEEINYNNIGISLNLTLILTVTQPKAWQEFHITTLVKS